MPRASRASIGGICYHVVNRGNARRDGRDVFHKDGDFQAFLKAMAHACIEMPMPVLAYCLMSNHFHLVLWPQHDGDLSTWMHWLLNTHIRRYHQHYHSSGHIWQGRFKAFPIEADDHLLRVLRYVERNPLRANVVERAEHWPWSSARFVGVQGREASYLATGPVARPSDWLQWVNEPLTEAELAALRQSVNRGRPYGSAGWVERTAERLQLQATLRPRGRPRKPQRGLRAVINVPVPFSGHKDKATDFHAG